MARDPTDPLLLTPGPVATSVTTKQAMMRDRASGGEEFQADIAFARHYLVGLVHGEGAYTAVPLPGSATYANEAVISGLVPAGGKLLIFSNGVYGDRLIEIASHLGKPHAVLRTAPFTPPREAAFDAAFTADPALTHLFIVHCETSTGVLNPVEAAAAACRSHGKGLLIDAVASFGAIPRFWAASSSARSSSVRPLRRATFAGPSARLTRRPIRARVAGSFRAAAADGGLDLYGHRNSIGHGSASSAGRSTWVGGAAASDRVYHRR